MMLTACQIRGARAVLRWTVGTLALRSGVAQFTIRRLEHSVSELNDTDATTVRAIRHAFEGAGIEFLADDGAPEGGPGLRNRQAVGRQAPGADPLTLV